MALSRRPLLGVGLLIAALLIAAVWHYGESGCAPTPPTAVHVVSLTPTDITWWVASPTQTFVVPDRASGLAHLCDEHQHCWTVAELRRRWEGGR